MSVDKEQELYLLFEDMIIYGSCMMDESGKRIPPNEWSKINLGKGRR